MRDYQALIFHHRDVNLEDLPNKRDSKQIYIYYNLESPVYSNPGTCQ